MECVSSALRSLGCFWCWDPLRPADGYNLESFLFKRLPIFWVMGPSKCGKSELAEMLSKSTKYHLLKVGELLTNPNQKDKFRARIINDYLQKGANVSNDIVLNVLKEAFLATHHKARGYIIVDFPLSIDDAKLFELQICQVNMVIYITLELNDFLNKIKNDDSVDIDAARNKFIEDTKKIDVVYDKYEGKAIKMYSTNSPEETCRQLVQDLKDFYGYKF